MSLKISGTKAKIPFQFNLLLNFIRIRCRSRYKIITRTRRKIDYQNELKYKIIFYNLSGMEQGSEIRGRKLIRQEVWGPGVNPLGGSWILENWNCDYLRKVITHVLIITSDRNSESR